MASSGRSGTPGSWPDSSDGGRTFQRLPLAPGLYGTFAAVRAYSPTVVLAGGQDLGLLRSTDGGATFTRISASTASPPSAIWTDGTDILVGDNYGGIVKSSDGGQTFAGKAAAPPTTVVRGFAALGRERFAVASLTTIMQSSDAGETWSAATVPAGLSRDLFDVAAAGGDVWAVGLQGAVLRRPAGATAFALVASASTVNLTSAAATPGGSLLASGVGGQLLRGSAGALATVAAGTDVAVTDMLFTSPGHLVATTSAGGLLRSSDGGHTFTATTPAPRRIQNGVTAGAPAELYLSGADSLPLRSTNGGDSFAPLPGPRTYPVSLGRIWADAQGRVVVREDRVDQVHLSVDHGQTWNTRTMSGVSGGDGKGLWYDGAGTLWAGGATAVYKSPDAGMTWTSAYNIAASVFAVWGTGPNDIYITAGASGGIAHSADGGANWTLQVAVGGNQAYGGYVGIWSSSPDDVYVVGSRGVVLRSTDCGTSWIREEATTASSVVAITGSSAAEVIIGGTGLLRRR